MAIDDFSDFADSSDCSSHFHIISFLLQFILASFSIFNFFYAPLSYREWEREAVGRARGNWSIIICNEPRWFRFQFAKSKSKHLEQIFYFMAIFLECSSSSCSMLTKSNLELIMRNKFTQHLQTGSQCGVGGCVARKIVANRFRCVYISAFCSPKFLLIELKLQFH